MSLPSAAPARNTPFYCALCQKGYARIHEYEAHENSYDHQHKKRFAEMKAMQRPSQSAASEKARRADEKAGLIAISLKKEDAGGKKAKGFRRAFGGGEKVSVLGQTEKEVKKVEVDEDGLEESDSDEEMEWERYDPARPTGI